MVVHAAVLSRNQLFRAALVSLLNMMGFDRIEEGSDVNELKRERNGKVGPEILLIDLSPGVEEIAISMEAVRSWLPSAKVVFLAGNFDLDLLSRCFAAGASGFLLENISLEAFQESLKLVCAGEKVFPSTLAALMPSLTSRLSDPAINVVELQNFHLTEREMDILGCLANGQSNKVIAHELQIAEATVKVHVKRIMQKIHVTNRTQAALWAAERGLLERRKLGVSV